MRIKSTKKKAVYVTMVDPDKIHPTECTTVYESTPQRAMSWFKKSCQSAHASTDNASKKSPPARETTAA